MGQTEADLAVKNWAIMFCCGSSAATKMYPTICNHLPGSPLLCYNVQDRGSATVQLEVQKGMTPAVSFILGTQLLGL